MNNIANPLQRFISSILDFFINLTVPLVFLFMLSGVSDPTEFLGKVSSYLVFLIFVYPVLCAFVTAWFVSTLGGTLGKLLTGLAITGPSGKNLGYWRAFFRNYVGYTISGLLFGAGFFWIIIDKERRGWHDQIADSYVVVRNKALSFVGIVFLVVVIFLQFLLISNSIGRFASNKNVYQEFANSLSQEELPQEEFNPEDFILEQ